MNGRYKKTISLQVSLIVLRINLRLLILENRSFLRLNQQIPGEKLNEGQQYFKVYVSDVDRVELKEQLYCC